MKKQNPPSQETNKCDNCVLANILKSCIAINEQILRTATKDKQQEAISQFLPGQLN
jgi:hypothetical protein